MTSNIPERIVFFDGVCGLCNGFVDWLLRKDRRGRLRMAPIQGLTARSLGISAEGVEPDSIVFYRKGKMFRESGAAIRLVADLGGFGKIAIILLAVPGFIRDGVYRYVARNRYRWFGRLDACRIPEPQERRFFLE
jgi:predicted DCC family thiol-disulfide oxidoreductase YuxK